MQHSPAITSDRPVLEPCGGARPQREALLALETAHGIRFEDYGEPGDADFGAPEGWLHFRMHPDIGEGWWRFALVSPGLSVTMSDLVCHEDSALSLPMDDYLTIKFVLSGRNTWQTDFSGDIDLSRPHCVAALCTGQSRIAVRAYAGARQTSVTLHCSRSFLRSVIGSDTPPAPREVHDFVDGEHETPWLRNVPASSAMLRIARSIFDSPYRGGLRRLHTEAKSLELFCHVMQPALLGVAARRPELRLTRRDYSNLHAARELMGSHHASPLTIAELSRQCGINEYKLKAGFRQLFGVSVFDYCHGVRMNRAREMLADSGASIGSVAEAVGYRHASSFATAFKAHFGYQPRRTCKRE